MTELERCDDEIAVGGVQVIRCALEADGHRTHRQTLTVGNTFDQVREVEVRWARRGEPTEEGSG